MSYTREKAIKEILKRHGTEAVYIFSLGYISRTAYKLCEGKYNAFYMLGSMGLTLAIGLGIKRCVNRDVVVVRGNGDKMFCPGNPYMEENHRPMEYIIDNDAYESTGGQKSVCVENWYHCCMGYAMLTRPSPPDPRITKDPKEIARDIIHCLAG